MSEQSRLAAPRPPDAPVREAMQAGRLHELDAMRSVLMLLGIVLHAANPYLTGGDWLVADPARDGAFDAIDGVIHLFRMPAFFIVAGYFAMLLLRRRARLPFLRERLRRTLLPAATVLLTFNLVQVWYLAAPAAPAAFVRDILPAAWHSGAWLGHLWFLVYLAIYCIALAALRTPLLRSLPVLHAGRPRWILAAMLAVVVLIPLAGAWLAHARPALSQPVLGLFDPIELATYASFFGAGCLLQADDRLLWRFSTAGAGTWMAAAVAAVVLATAGHERPLMTALSLVAQSVLAWCLARMVFAAFRRWAGKPSRVFRYLSQASYSMYLFHHLFVVVIASMLVPLAWPAAGKYAIVLLGASLLPLAMHHFLVRPYPLARLLVNGSARGEEAALRGEPGMARAP